MAWWTDDIPVFDPPSAHADWAGAAPTPTEDVLSFMLRPGPEWAAFGLAYAGCVARVRHRRSEGGARVEVFLPKVDASDSDIDLDERWYLSLWLAPAPVGYEVGPTVQVEYRLGDDVHASVELDAADSVWFALFTGPLEDA